MKGFNDFDPIKTNTKKPVING